MIITCETQDFVPFGREHCSHHPGKVELQVQNRTAAGHGSPLVRALSDISLREDKRESWKLRSCTTEKSEPCDEELYVKEDTVVWSRGSHGSSRTVIKSFSMDFSVREAMWCTFMLPKGKEGDGSETLEDPEGEIQQGVCVLQDSCLHVFATSGKEYIAALPFQVSRVWEMGRGLLLERTPTQAEVGAVKKDPQTLPILFSLIHPLDEVAPVVIKGGPGASGIGKVQFMSDQSQEIVFTSECPCLVMMYDTHLGLHSVWSARKAKPEEAFFSTIPGTDTMTLSALPSLSQTPGQGRSSYFSATGSHSKLTLSSQSPSMSPLRSYSSRLNSPLQSRLSLSPSISHLAMSRTQSPSLSMSASGVLRYQTPPHLHVPQSPMDQTDIHVNPGTPISQNVSMMNESMTEGEPLTPDICMEHIWTEKVTGSRDRSRGKAKKGFITTDPCGQRFLCYLVPYGQQLRCVKFEESNDKSQLIFGSVTVIPALDALPLESIDAMLVLDPSSTLYLYSGIKKMNAVHVQGVPPPSLPVTPGLVSGKHSLLYGLSPHPHGYMTSSRPPSAMEVRFEDEVNMLSPVPTEMSDTSYQLDTSMPEEFPYPRYPIQGIRDAVDNRFSVELSNGTLWRTALPLMSSSPHIKLCLEAVKHVLPKDTALQVFIKWYSTQNSPGGTTNQSEWNKFVKCLLGMMGYDTERLPIMQQLQDLDLSHSPAIVVKKARPSDEGSNEDWSYLINSDHHRYMTQTHGTVLGLDPVGSIPSGKKEEARACVDSTSLLFSHAPSVFFAIHLVYEELKLNSMSHEELKSLSLVLFQLARDLKLEDYVRMYCREYAELSQLMDEGSQIRDDQLKHLSFPTFLTKEPPNIYLWLYNFMKGSEMGPFPYISSVSQRTKITIAIYVSFFHTNVGESESISWDQYLKRVTVAGHRSTEPEDSILAKNYMSNKLTSCHEKMVLFMTESGFTLKDLEFLPFGVSLPLREAKFQCRVNPPSDWPEQAYVLVGRQDLSKQMGNKVKVAKPTTLATRDTSTSWQFKAIKEEDDGMDCLDERLLRLRFSEDLRVQEVRHLLQSSKPVRISIAQRPEVSDHDFIEEQETQLYAFCIRTMALPLGRGMFTLCTYHPVATETLPIPKLCLVGRAPPRNNTIDLSHIGTPPNMSAWPQFHNGVAAGLRIANSSQIDSTWIMYNKPKSNELTNEHAGFLMALGLNGHLSKLDTLNVHDYLCKGHEMTSVGLLLGIAAAKRGSMDVSTTRLLSIHLDALLPPTSTELDINHVVQVAAILGVGIVYQGTAHRHMAEVLLSEIGRPPGPEMENCTDRESYSLAAGLALGLVMLGRGSEAMGLSDLNMADQLYNYMVGGHKRPLTGANKERFKSPSYQIKEGDTVNVDVTAPGATLALGMMFFRTNNKAVANWLTACDTQFLLDFVRPDFLMLRIISRGLVLWDCIQPTSEWVEANVPPIVARYGLNKGAEVDDESDIDYETMSQAYLNIVAGGCMAIGLRFAGSANRMAYNCLLEYSKKFIKHLTLPAMVEQAGKSAIENCMVVVVLALAMVMAGTGDLEVLRICRYLRSRVGPSYNYVLYGSYMAISQAIGLLYMGGGRYTLSTKPEAVAAMLCAFFPKFPTHSNDNRYHLQAFRHLYVLAAEPRILLPKDVDAGTFCYVPVEVKFRDTDAYSGQKFSCVAPCILPELDLLEEVRVMGDRYLPITFNIAKNWNNLRNILQTSGMLHVKQRAGHLSYVEDPKGYRSLLAKSLTNDQSGRRNVKPEVIKSFSSDPRVLAFAESFCDQDNNKEYDIMQLLSLILHECVTQEKPEVLSPHIAMDQVSRTFQKKARMVDIWQVKLIMAYYNSPIVKASCRHSALIHPEFLSHIKNRIEFRLDKWLADSCDTFCRYLLGETVTSDPLLATFVAWYDIQPSSKLLPLINIGSGVPSFPNLYQKLQPSGLPVSAVMKIHKALSQKR